MENTKCESCDCPERRGFFKKLASYVIGAVLTVFPFAAGLAVWFDPVRRKNGTGGQFVRVGRLSALPDDGVPRKFTVIASRVDAWNRSPETVVGERVRGIGAGGIRHEHGDSERDRREYFGFVRLHAERNNSLRPRLRD